MNNRQRCHSSCEKQRIQLGLISVMCVAHNYRRRTSQTHKYTVYTHKDMIFQLPYAHVQLEISIAAGNEWVWKSWCNVLIAYKIVVTHIHTYKRIKVLLWLHKLHSFKNCMLLPEFANRPAAAASIQQIHNNAVGFGNLFPDPCCIVAATVYASMTCTYFAVCWCCCFVIANMAKWLYVTNCLWTR